MIKTEEKDYLVSVSIYTPKSTTVRAATYGATLLGAESVLPNVIFRFWSSQIGFDINLAGSCLMEPGVATIDYVGTKVIHSGTPGAMPPVTIFSEKLLEEPIPVSEGQLITVEVEYTFVSG